jgi:hypothetical protein
MNHIRFACAVCTSEPAEHWFVTSAIVAIFVKKIAFFSVLSCKTYMLEPMLKKWRKKNYVKYVSSKVLVVVFYNPIAERFSIFIPF